MICYLPRHIGIPMGARIIAAADPDEGPPRRKRKRFVQAPYAHPWDLPGCPKGYFSSMRGYRPDGVDTADRIEQEVNAEREAERMARAFALKYDPGAEPGWEQFGLTSEGGEA